MSDITQTLQEIGGLEGKIHEINKKLKRIPKKITEARKQLSAEEVLLAEVEGPFEELEQRIQQKEDTITLALETIDKFEEHMKKVTSQKEYMAAKKQVDDARRLNEQLQNEILEARMSQEELAPRLKEIRTARDEVLSTFQKDEKTLTQEKNKAEKEKGKLTDIMKGFMEKLSDNMVSYYGRLSSSGKRPSIVPVSDGTCAGCNMKIPPQSYNLMIARPEEMHTCSHCARILFYSPAPEPEEPEDSPKEASTGA